MNLLNLFVKLNLDDQASPKLGGITAGMIAKGNIMADAFSAALGGVTQLASGVANGIATIGRGAFDAYSNYEQLSGGVESLFGSAADSVLRNAERAYVNAGMSANQYLETVTSFAAALLQSTAQRGQEIVQVDVEAMQRAAQEQQAAAQKAFQAELKATQAHLNKVYSETQKAYARQLSQLQKELEAEVKAVEKANADQLSTVQKAHEQQVRSYEKATEARLKLLEREHDEAIKAIDRERTSRIAAIDEQIARIEGQTDAERKAIEERERKEKVAELEKAVTSEKTYARREEARKKLAEYLERVEQQEREEARKAQIASLKEQRDAVRDETDQRKEAAKESYSAEVEAYKESRAEQLEAMREANKEQEAALREAMQEQVAAMRESNQERLSALRESQQAELEAMKEAHAAEVDAMRESQQASLDAMREASQERIALAQAEAEAVGGAIEQTAESREEAARLANLAIVDMSDNANRMGTDMEAIQYAYQGFAKGNFTMLDNLKLGFGGTKTEMERLLSRAEELKAKNGEMADYSIDSFADMVEAIHVVQEELYISGMSADEAAAAVASGALTQEEAYKLMGTTALEAEQTIQGSFMRMGAAWENWLLALSNPDADLGQATDDLMDTVFVAMDNALPRIGEIVTRAVEVIGEKGPEVVEKMKAYIEQWIADTFGEDALAQFQGFIDGIAEKLQGVMEFVGGLSEAGEFLQGAFDMFERFGSSFDEHLGPALTYLNEQMGRFGGQVGESELDVGRWVEAAGRVLFLVLGSIANIVGTVIEVITTMGEVLGALGEGIGSVIETVREFGEGVMAKFGEAKEAVLGFARDAKGRIDEFIWNIMQVPNKAAELRDSVIAKFGEVVEWFQGLPQRIMEAVGDLGETLFSAGGDIIQGLMDGIGEKFGSLGEVLGNVGEFIVEHKGPPSYDRVMLRENGRLIMGGLIGSIEDSLPELGGVMGQANAVIAGGITAKPTARLAGAAAAMGGGVTIHIDEMSVRDDRDINRVAEQLNLLTQRAIEANMGGMAWSL